MKNITINTQLSVFETLQELPNDVQDLMHQAIEIRQKAYAPYSKFRVGAALLLDNGKVVLGSNQENAAYPSGLCAERVAIFQSGAVYPEAKIVKMAITASKSILWVKSEPFTNRIHLKIYCHSHSIKTSCSNRKNYAFKFYFLLGMFYFCLSQICVRLLFCVFKKQLYINNQVTKTDERSY